MKKRMLALLLVAAMLLMLAACGGSAATASAAASAASAEAGEETAPDEAAAPVADEADDDIDEDSAEEASAVEEAAEPAGYAYGGEWAEYPLCDAGAETLTVWCEFPGFLAMIGMDTYNNMSVWAAAEEATGVHVEFTEVSMMNASEQFSLMCAANDMKDLVQNVASYYGSAAAAVEDEIAIDLAEYAEEYMGNYLTTLNKPEYKADREKAYNIEGQLVEIKSIADDAKPGNGAQIRQDWLDALGLDTPETYDDWEKTLLAFKDAYNCSNTLLLSGVTQTTNLLSGYATAGASEDSAVNMYQIDGVVKCGYQDDSYRAYLTMLNRWYTAGLLSPDFITGSNDGSQNNTDGTILSGDAGIWFSQGNFIDQYTSQATVSEPDFAIAALPNPYSPEYNPEKTTHFTSASGGNGGGSPLSVSTNCEDIELACKWLDYFWTEEGITLCNYGIEGEGFEYDENGEPKFTALVTDSGNYQFYMVGYTLSGAPTLTDFDKSFFTYSDTVLNAFDIWDDCSDDAYLIPDAMTLSTEQSEAYSQKFSDINTMAQEYVGKFITGETDIETEWDTFQKNLTSMGIEDCVAIYQEAYDTYVAARS